MPDFYRCKCGHEFEDIVSVCPACGRDDSYWEKVENENNNN